MKSLRRLEIGIINVIILGYLVKEMYSADVSDTLGMFTLIVIFFLIIFNIYAVIILNYFKWDFRNKVLTESLFLFLLLAPIIAVWLIIFYFL
jgi:hypothetical protein